MHNVFLQLLFNKKGEMFPHENIVISRIWTKYVLRVKFILPQNISLPWSNNLLKIPPWWENRHIITLQNKRQELLLLFHNILKLSSFFHGHKIGMLKIGIICIKKIEESKRWFYKHDWQNLHSLWGGVIRYLPTWIW